MKNKAPSLIEAFYKWIVDSDKTPNFVGNIDVDGVKAPKQYAKDGQIVLDIAPDAVDDLIIDQEGMSFISYFGGSTEGEHIFFPLKSWVALVCAETGDGISFDLSDLELTEQSDEQSAVSEVKSSGKLRIVEDED